MIDHSSLDSKSLFHAIKSGRIKLAGNKKLKIYGTLTCSSGKRMHKRNRVFFEIESEAIAAGYRPCGHCLNSQYREWKTNPS